MSSARYRALKGMQDVLPPDVHLWQIVEDAAKQVFGLYGFQEIRPPVLESTDLFLRSIGETTDIVEKEMYTFEDKGGRSVSLRPEGTAPVVRSYVEKSLYTLPSPQKFFYSGPMFRYERPQSGRFRQFYQIGAEAFGSPHPEMDAEVLAMLGRFLGAVGLKELAVQVNSIGCDVCRPGFKEALLKFFGDHLDNLCPDCKRRYEMNPLRILDCKVDRCRELRKGSPPITASLCDGCGSHFERLRSLLSAMGIRYEVNPDMVRGLDYYTRTTFEVTSSDLGAQSAVAAGGRYDRLVREFGGPDTPAVGFAIGMERLVELVKRIRTDGAAVPDVFMATMGDDAGREGMLLSERLRENGLWVERGGESSLKSQLRRADRVAARYVFILGEDELREGMLQWKDLKEGSTGKVPMSEAASFIKNSIR